MNTEMLFKTICGAVIIVMLIYYMKREKKILSFLFGAFTGAAALILINKYGFFIGADVHLNTFNLAGSVVLGVPFVVFLVIMNYL